MEIYCHKAEGEEEEEEEEEEVEEAMNQEDQGEEWIGVIHIYITEAKGLLKLSIIYHGVLTLFLYLQFLQRRGLPLVGKVYSLKHWHSRETKLECTYIDSVSIHTKVIEIDIQCKINHIRNKNNKNQLTN